MNRKLLDEQPLIILPSLAAAIGLHEAVVLQQINFFLCASQHEHEGRRWVYNSYPKWQAQMPFLTAEQIKRAILALEARGLLVTGNFNKSKIDRTKWYSIDREAVDALPDIAPVVPLPSDDSTPPQCETLPPSCAQAPAKCSTAPPIPQSTTKREPDHASPSQTQEKRDDAPIPNTKGAQFRRWAHVPGIYRRYVDADTENCFLTDTKLTWLFVDAHDAQVQAGKYSIQDVIDRIAELVKWSWTNPAVADLMDARHEAYCADHRGYVRDMEAMEAERAAVEARRAQR